MPTYDYKCNNCGHHFEEFQSMKDDKLIVCPKCGKESLVRLIGTGVGLIFKGTGFYLTDYKNTSGSKPSSEPVKETKSPGETSAAEKQDTTAIPASDNASKKIKSETPVKNSKGSKKE